MGTRASSAAGVSCMLAVPHTNDMQVTCGSCTCFTHTVYALHVSVSPLPFTVYAVHHVVCRTYSAIIVCMLALCSLLSVVACIDY